MSVSLYTPQSNYTRSELQMMTTLTTTVMMSVMKMRVTKIMTMILMKMQMTILMMMQMTNERMMIVTMTMTRRLMKTTNGRIRCCCGDYYSLPMR